MRAPRVTRLLLAAALVLLPVSASALPVAYSFTSGTLTVSALLLPSTTVLLNGSPSVSAALTGTSFTFDTALVPLAGNDMSISAFTFVTSPTGVLSLTPSVGSVTQISFGALTITAGGGFVSSASGTGPYNFTMGPIAVTGSATTNLGPSAVNVSTPSANGSINLGTNTISLQGITIGAITTTGGTLLVKGDFVFHGVPEPGAALLVAFGAVAFAGLRRRRSC
jgi:hypothetical protein